MTGLDKAILQKEIQEKLWELIDNQETNHCTTCQCDVDVKDYTPNNQKVENLSTELMKIIERYEK